MSTITARRFRLLLSAGAVVLAVAGGPPSAVADPAGQNGVGERLGEIGAWAVPSTSDRKPLASESRPAIVREKLGEIGAWAVSSTAKETRLVSDSHPAIVRDKLGEIGAWAVPTEKRLASDSHPAIVREKLGEIGAWAVSSTASEGRLVSEKRDMLNPSAPPATIASRNGGFEWRDAVIGALVALCAAAAAAVAVRKRMSPATH
jgi:hypothetical protein